MSSFLGNLLLTSIICTVVILFTLIISPWMKKYTKKWRYIIFIMVAVKLLLPIPMYTADSAIIISIAPKESTEENSRVNSNAGIDAAKENISNINSKQEDGNTTGIQNMENNGVTNSQSRWKVSEVVEGQSQPQNSKVTEGQSYPHNSEVVNQDPSAKNIVSKIKNVFASCIANIDMENIYKVLFSIWCMGFIASGAFYISVFFYNRKSLDRWSIKVTDEKLLVILDEEKTRLNITKNIVLKKCKRINTPMTSGFIHLSIILPYTEYNEENVRYIFRHELVHQKRRDIYAKVLFVATKCLHWFNPVVRTMVNRAYDDMEILCDDMVVEDMRKEQRIEYNRTILNIAKLKLEQATGQNILFTFCLVEKESNLKERVINIMVMNKRKKGYQIVAFAMALILAGSCFISCGKKPEEIKNTNTTVQKTTVEAVTEKSNRKKKQKKAVKPLQPVFE